MYNNYNIILRHDCDVLPFDSQTLVLLHGILHTVITLPQISKSNNTSTETASGPSQLFEPSFMMSILPSLPFYISSLLHKLYTRSNPSHHQYTTNSQPANRFAHNHSHKAQYSHSEPSAFFNHGHVR